MQVFSIPSFVMLSISDTTYVNVVILIFSLDCVLSIFCRCLLLHFFSVSNLVVLILFYLHKKIKKGKWCI